MPPTPSARPPRVEFICNSLVIGGAERVVERLCLQLPEHGFRTGVTTLREPGLVGEALEREGVSVRPNLAPRRVDPFQIGSVARHLRRVEADLAFVLDHGNALLYGRLAAALCGIPQLMAVHRTRRADGTASLGRFDRWLMPLSRRVIAVSDGHARYLAQKEGVDPARLCVVHNGVDTEVFRPHTPAEREALRQELGLPAEAVVATVVAALRPEKNHELLLEALAREASLDELWLAFAGEGSRESALRQRSQELGLDHRIRWLGARTDVARILPAMDILVLPSHPMVETFPLCVLEAMATGLPVVATDVGSLDEMVVDGETGRLVAAGDARALAAGLVEMVHDAGRRERWGGAGRHRVEEHFDSRTMVARTAELLRDLL